MEDSRCPEAHQIEEQLIAANVQLKKAETYPGRVKERFRAYCQLMNTNEQMRLHVAGCAKCLHFNVAARTPRLPVRKRPATESAQVVQ